MYYVAQQPESQDLKSIFKSTKEKYYQAHLTQLRDNGT